MTKFKKALTTLMAIACTASALCVPMNVSAADDHGNSISTATTITGSSNTGTIDYSEDIDYFKYTATKNGIRYFKASGSSNAIVNILNSNGTIIASSSSGISNKHCIGYNMVSGSTYYITVRAGSSGYGTSYTLQNFNSLPVSHLSQVDSRWTNTPLEGTTNQTIGTSGCALTAFTMVTNYLKNTSHIPTDFNNSSYISGGEFMFETGANNQGITRSVVTQSTAIQDLAKGKPVIIKILKSDGYYHFVVAVGYIDNDIYVKDPGVSSSSWRKLSSAYTGCTIIRYDSYKY